MVNLSIYKGDDKTFQLEVTDEKDEIINLSGCTLYFSVTDWQGTELFNKSSNNITEIDIIDPTAGIADIMIVPANTTGLDPDIYIIYIKYTNILGKLYTIAHGEFQILDLGTLSYMRNRVRNYNGDKEELNVLIREQECTDEELNGYIKKAIEFFNAVGYQTTYIMSNYPNMGNLIDGTIIQILQGKGILSARNLLTYQDSGGVTVQDFDVYGRYINLYNVFVNKYYTQCMDIKRSINIDNCYGSISSPMQDLSANWD